jgi:dienelactone hydrolase
MTIRVALPITLLGFFLTSAVAAADPLPGTKPLELDRPLDEVMVDGISKFALREIEASVERRASLWKRDFNSVVAYEASIAPNRERFRTIIGAVDERLPVNGFGFVATTRKSQLVARSDELMMYAVRWEVLPGVTTEGILIEPTSKPIARVVAVPDADWSPEVVAGIVESQGASNFAAQLALRGCQVYVPTIINRDDTFSGHPDVRYTNQPHREFIYRQAFELGRHIIGYEVQKVLSAIDQFEDLNKDQAVDLPLGVVGVGEGGLLAMYSAALDTRIDFAFVSGYFGPREDVWQEPIYRNVWGLLHEFGDAEIAGLIAPRCLVIEIADAPEIAGPPPVRPGRTGGAAPGRIVRPNVDAVRREFERASAIYEKSFQLKPQSAHAEIELVFSVLPPRRPARAEALTDLLAKFVAREQLEPKSQQPTVKLSTAPEEFAMLAQARQRRQFAELVEFTQRLLHRSYRVRDQLWSKADRSSAAAYEKSAEALRNLVYDEMIGRLPEPSMPPNVRSRQVMDEPEYRAYEVVIDVYPDIIAGGVLLLPKDLKPGEKRPVVVCQHGLEGVPIDTIRKDVDGFKYYSAFASELCKRGFITYAPQNPYRGQDRFRVIQRKSNPLKLSLFSYIIPQHQRTLDWLASLPDADPTRLAFYGLSYGGKTAVRVPPMLPPRDGKPGYCLSICSADYNEWVAKNASVECPFSYVFTGEYEIFEWNMGHYANYAELSYLMTPRPFMVERGHDDGVSYDEWVAWEYAKVRRHYNKLGLGDKTEIEFFNGPHKINGVATYDFLHRHLNWPKHSTASGG